MQFMTEEKRGVKILRLNEKRLDTATAPHLKVELIVLTGKDPCKIIVDLNDVVYADSSGLGALLLGLRQARDKGGRLVLLNIQKRVKDLIHIARLEDVLLSFENEDEAIAYLHSADEEGKKG